MSNYITDLESRIKKYEDRKDHTLQLRTFENDDDEFTVLTVTFPSEVDGYEFGRFHLLFDEVHAFLYILNNDDIIFKGDEIVGKK